MTLADNKMIHCLFNIAQFLNNFNSSDKIKPAVKEALQDPLATYHQQKDAYQEVLANNPSNEPITQPDHLAKAQKALKNIKINAQLDQPKVVDNVNDINAFLKEQLSHEEDPPVVNAGDDEDDDDDTEPGGVTTIAVTTTTTTTVITHTEDPSDSDSENT